MTHGIYNTYNRGCRCDECRAAYAAYRRESRKRAYLRHGAPSVIDGTGTRRRIQALNALGWSLDRIDAAMGVQRSYCSMVIRRQGVTPATRKLVADVFDRLCMTPGPSTRAAAWAKRKGYLPPLAWDNIDDPNETPTLHDSGDELDEVVVLRLMNGEHVKATRAEKVEACRRLSAGGRSDREVGDLLGTTWRTVQRWRAEFGIESRWAA